MVSVVAYVGKWTIASDSSRRRVAAVDAVLAVVALNEATASACALSGWSSRSLQVLIHVLHASRRAL